MSDFTFIVLGMPKLMQRIDRYHGPQLDRATANASFAAVKTLVSPLRAAAPVGGTRKRAGRTVRGGKLAKSVKATRAKRQDAPGAIVGPRIWYRHFPIRGTRRGVKPNDFVGRTVRGKMGAVRAKYLSELHRTLTK